MNKTIFSNLNFKFGFRIRISRMFRIFINDQTGAPPKTTFTVDSCSTDDFTESAAQVEIQPVYLV